MNANKTTGRTHRYLSACVALLVPLLVTGPPALASDFEKVNETLASDADASGFYGHAVAIDGNTAVIGANEHDHNGVSNSGGAYIVTRKPDGTWSEPDELIPGDGAADDLFGYSVGISGDTAVVGATNVDDLGNNTGSAYVFIDTGNDDWVLQQELHAGNSQLDQRFGIAAAIDGDTIIVSSSGYSKDLGGGNMLSESGAAFVFVRDGANVWTEQQRLEAFDLDPNDGVDEGPRAGAHFGSSISIDGDAAIIGAKDDGQNGFQAGAAYVFTRDANGTWNPQQKLKAPPGDVTTRDQFGASVAISGDTVLVGVQTSDVGGAESGSAYVFTVDVNGGWSQQARFDGLANDQFGISVGLSGNSAIVGAIGQLPLGHARVFSRDGNGTWTEQAAPLAAQAGISGGAFGFSVAMSANRAVVGHKFRNDNAGIGPGIGSAHFFESASAEALIQDLVAAVMLLNLNQGIQNALDAKLNAALMALDDMNDGNDQAAINSLVAFMNHVAAQSGKQIDADDAAALIAAAQEIVGLLMGA